MTRANVVTARELAERQAVETMLASRAILRNARADFIAAVKACRAAGVDDGHIADELLRDTVRHDPRTAVLDSIVAREALS